MKEYPAFNASQQDIIDLIASQRLARIVTIDPEGIPRIGVHVFVHDGLTVELHLVADDPQLEDIRRGSPVVIEVDEVLANSPSHWVDPANATHADQFYRCASLWGATEVTTDIDAVSSHLSEIMRRYQPEGRHEPVAPDHDFYAKAMRRLAIVRIQGTSTRSKFKLAQRTGRESREKILRGFHERGAPLDPRTAELIEQARDGA
jgi:predicted FMN-binding regulatory protein PaiB